MGLEGRRRGRAAVGHRWRGAAVLAGAALLLATAGCGSAEDAAPPTTRALTVATYPSDDEPPPTTLPPPTAYADRVSITVNLPYTTTGEGFDLYRPMREGAFPLVVLFPGRASDKSAYGEVAARLAAEGVVVGVPNYEASLARPADDARCAIGAITDVVAREVGEPTRLALAGYAFGAVVAVGEGLGGPWASAPVARDHCPAPPPSRPVHAVIGVVGDYDRFGGTTGSAGPPATWDPFEQLGAAPVPVWLVHGAKDALDVGPEVSVAFADALARAGHPHELVIADDVPNLALIGLGVDPATGTVEVLEGAHQQGLDVTVTQVLAALA